MEKVGENGLQFVIRWNKKTKWNGVGVVGLLEWIMDNGGLGNGELGSELGLAWFVSGSQGDPFH
jgi:hypothetical protein